MSDIRFNQWLHQSGTGGVSQVASGAVGVGTTNPLADFYVRGDAQITGILTAGHIAMGSSITFGDGDRAYFGDGTDMQLYHNGTNSYIENGTNALNIKSYQTFLQNANGSEDYLKATDGYGVELYHNNNKRIETTGLGVTVFGTTQTQQLNVSGVTTISHTGSNQLTIKDSNSTGNAAEMRISFKDSGGTEKFFVGSNESSNSWFYLGTPSGQNQPVSIRINGSDRFQVNSNGVSVNGSYYVQDSLIHDGDTNTKIRFPAADQISFETGGTNRLKLHYYASNHHVEVDASAHLSLADNGSNGRFIYMGDANASSTGYMHLQPGPGSQGMGGGIRLYSHSNSTNPGGVYIGKSLNSSGAIIFGNGGMTPSTEYFRIHGTGHVGIGTNNPLNKLDVRSGISVYSPNGQVRYQLGVDNSNGVDLTSKNAAGSFNTYQINAGTFKVRTTGTNSPATRFLIDGNGNIGIATDTPSNSLQGAWNKILVISAGTSNGSMIRFIESSSASGGASSGMLVGQHSNNSYIVNYQSGFMSLRTNNAERLRIKSDGKVVIGNPNGSGTGALTIYPNSITGNGRLDVYGGGDENSQTQARNEVMRIGRGDILDSYYHSIWSATGSGGATSHFLKFYVSNGTAGATNQKEALSMNGNGHVTKANHPSFCARHNGGDGFDGDIIVLTRMGNPSWDVWNTGGHYSTSTGKFTAPVTGVYYFEGQLMTTGHSNGDNIQDMLSLMSNNGRISYCRQRKTYFRSDEDANGYYTNSVGGSTRLSAGDTVWIQRQSGHSWSYSNRYYSYFTGWLIG